jgi:hypothetical protein
MLVKLEAARQLFAALGVSGTEKMNAAKLQTRLGKIQDIADEDTEVEDAKLQKLLTRVLKASTEGEDLTVEDVEADTAEAEAAPEKPAAKKKAANQVTSTPGGAGVTKKKKAKAEDEDEPKAKPTAPKTPKAVSKGVRDGRTRPYLAGIVLKLHVGEGVTDDMVKELNAAYGDENETESRFALRNAYHAIRGFNTKDNEGDLELPTE